MEKEGSGHRSFWDKWKPSAIGFSQLRPGRMWDDIYAPAFSGQRTEDSTGHAGYIPQVRDLFGRGWHGSDWRRRERGFGEGSGGQHSEDRWGVPLFRMGTLALAGGAANSAFGSPWEGGPGYGTLARQGGGALNRMGSMGGLAGMLGGGLGGMGGMGMPGMGGGQPSGGYGSPVRPIQTYRDPLAQGQGIPPGLMALLLQQQQQQPGEPQSSSYNLGTTGLA